MAVWYIYRDKTNSGERNFIEQIKIPIFLEGTSSNRGSAKVPVQCTGERDNPSLLKDSFFSTVDQSIFTSKAPALLENKTSQVFPALKSTSHFLPDSSV